MSNFKSDMMNNTIIQKFSRKKQQYIPIPDLPSSSSSFSIESTAPVNIHHQYIHHQLINNNSNSSSSSNYDKSQTASSSSSSSAFHKLKRYFDPNHYFSHRMNHDDEEEDEYVCKGENDVIYDDEEEGEEHRSPTFLSSCYSYITSFSSSSPHHHFPSSSAQLSQSSSHCHYFVDKNRSTLKFFSLMSSGLSFLVLLYLLFQIASDQYYSNIMLKSNLSRQTSFKPVSHPESPSPYWGTVVKPYPTGAFWTNLAVRQGDGPVAVLPYGVKTLDAGVQVSYGATRRSVSQLAITDPFVADLQISATQGYMSRGVESYDSISVAVAYKTALSGKYKTYLVKGSPYVTVVYENSTPIISAPLMRILNVESRIVKGSVGMQYIVTLGNFQKWFVYCSEPIALTWREDTLTSPAPLVKGIIRVAILPLQNLEGAFNILMNYVQRYPTGGSVAINHASASLSQLVYQFNSVGTGSLLMLALPHHLNAMLSTTNGNNNGNGGVNGPPGASTSTASSSTLSQQQSNNPCLFSNETKAAQLYYSPIYSTKGKFKGVVGDVWKLNYYLSPIGWNYQVSEAIPLWKLDEIGKSLTQDVTKIIPNAVDIYSFGKQIARMARLAAIADSLGIGDVRSQALTLVETAIIPWIQGTNQDALLYDRIYGGVVTTNGILDPNADFGNGYYNDHHFHYGYLIYAASIIARFDGAFFDVNKNAFDTIVRDVCNYDTTDTDFPYARHKDFFDGHSWASGTFPQANGKGQESSSEAANAYYSCYLYGLASSNTALMQFAHTLLSMEIQAAQIYWHMGTSDVYDGIFAAGRMVGNIGGLDVTASTWFGSQLEYVHGINVMPLTPVTAALFDTAYVMKEWTVLGSRLPPPPPSQSPATAPQTAECSSRPNCAALGMTGMCCPTPDGTFLACCSNNNGIGGGGTAGGMQDEWRGYIYAIHAIVNRDAAWSEILRTDGFGIGGSKSNSLFWTASRPAKLSLSDYDSSTSAPDYAAAIKPLCTLNSACDAAGLIGKCCPSDNPAGVYLGCCPQVTVTAGGSR